MVKLWHTSIPGSGNVWIRREISIHLKRFGKAVKRRGRCGNLFNDYYRGKNVLITGHTGFKGSWLSIWLTKLGANVMGYALEAPTEPAMFKLCKVYEKINSIYGDIRDREHLAKVVSQHKPEIIFHLAAQPLVRLSYENPIETFETNIMGTVNVFEIVRQSPSVKVVVNITTDKCYENTESFWGYRETDRLGGYDPYSSSKACSELITDSYRNAFFPPDKLEEHTVAIATVRAGNVIGGGDFALDRLVPDCIRGLIENKTILVRNPHAIRPWQHVLEPLYGYLQLARSLGLEGNKYSGAWNFGPEEKNEKNVEYIVKRLCGFWGKDNFYQIDINESPHETSYLKLDSYKARKLLGYKSKLDIDQALEMVVTWTNAYLNENINLYDFTLSQIDKYEQSKFS